MDYKDIKSGFKRSIFIIVLFSLLVIGGGKFLSQESILPLLITTKDHLKPKRKCGTFAEDFTEKASRGELIIKNKSSFSFIYTKSNRNGHAFTGVWFPLENLNIDFSNYDYIEIDIVTNRARRIPINLSVQNSLETHQYVRHFIEVEEEKTRYKLALKDFFTPSEWYTENNVTQSQIPEQDFSKVEAISFESCHLLEREIRDGFTVKSIVLRKDLTFLYAVVLILNVLGIFISWFKFQKKSIV